MERLKKHCALVVSVISIAVIFTVFVYVNSYAHNAVIYLQDVYGSVAELDDILVKGNLRDKYHNLYFEINNGEIKTSTKYSQHFKDVIAAKSHVMGMGEIIDGIDYDLRLNFQGRNLGAEITAIDRNTDRYSYGRAAFETDIISEKFSGGSYSLTNRDGYAMTKIDDKLYFTVLTTKDYTGTNGIFKVVKFADNTEYMNEQKTQDNIKTLNTFSLEGNKSGSSVTEVLGLEAVGDKLALILSVDDKLVIRGYDSESGTLLGETVIDDSNMSESDANNTGKSYYGNYDAFMDDESLNLCFRRSNSIPDVDERTIISLDFSDGVNLKYKIDVIFSDGEPERIFDIVRKNDKLYAAVLFKEYRSASIIPYEVMRPKHLILYVYSKDDLTYKGELITDMDEDMALERMKNHYGSFGYDIYDYRQFEGIEMR